MKKLEELTLSHRYTQLPAHFYAEQRIAPLQNLHLVSASSSVAQLLDLHPDELVRADFPEFFNGQRPLTGVRPIATAYAGHQFGHYVPQLGDGRALLLGEVEYAHQRWEIQLKGGGPTPFSRQGDGRAVLRSTIREYLCSEAMHALGIPTTRALCLFSSDTPVYREEVERGALLVRVASSHIRFGSFELFYYRNQIDDLRLLAEHVIRTVIRTTATLMAQWQSVGFAHGVMNTDNMSILGLTLDYGPFGFLDNYQPGFICNHSDHHGRYAFDQQPAIALWNCSCLAQALLPLIDIDSAREALSTFDEHFRHHYQRLMHAKLGLHEESPDTTALLNSLLDLLATHHVDYTLFFRKLGESGTQEGAQHTPLRDLFIERAACDRWVERYSAILQRQGISEQARQETMRCVNPKFILRNHLAQRAIEKAEQGDYAEINNLLTVLQRPYDEHIQFSRYAEPPPAGANPVVVSCSS
ncbi:MAG: hypothetical protein FD130_1104 [Halothiobacillaceae bacterium]|nr:MAG: hypothetical protein FD130_1104 [Halothiobacillaceae bacterium]